MHQQKSVVFIFLLLSGEGAASKFRLRLHYSMPHHFYFLPSTFLVCMIDAYCSSSLFTFFLIIYRKHGHHRTLLLLGEKQPPRKVAIIIIIFGGRWQIVLLTIIRINFIHTVLYTVQYSNSLWMLYSVHCTVFISCSYDVLNFFICIQQRYFDLNKFGSL